MRKGLTYLVTTALLAMTIGVPVPAQASGSEWVTRGKDANRTQSTAEALGPVAGVEFWPEPVQTGTTGSQPVVVGDRIYQLAGGGLWEITFDGKAKQLTFSENLVEDGPDMVSRPSTSGITYAKVNNRGVLYYGTGSNMVCAYGVDWEFQRCWKLTRKTLQEQPIVTVPTVFTVVQDGQEVDIVVMGTKRGDLWAIQGLVTARSPDEVESAHKQVGGWVLASPVKIDHPSGLAFIWATSDGGKGKIGSYHLVPQSATTALDFVEFWPTITPLAGVADGFAQDDDYAYASDTTGNFYRIDKNGSYRFLPYANTAGALFANASPAVDDKHVYFSIRNVGTNTPDNNKGGRLVALDKATFQIAWERNLPAPANTNPLVWTQGPNVVLIGDRKGTLHAFDRETGTPAPFAVKNHANSYCEPLTRLDLGAPAQEGEAFQTYTGISEPILASGSTGQGLLVLGVSGKDEGRLVAFRTGGAYNVAWDTTSKPPATVAVGQEYWVTGHLTLNPWQSPPDVSRQTTVDAYWVADGGGARRVSRQTVTLQAGVPSPLTVAFTPTAADGTKGTLKLFANPQQVVLTATETGSAYREALQQSGEPLAGPVAQALADHDYASAVQRVASGWLPGNCQGSETELLPAGPDAAMADNLLQAPLTINQQIDLAILAVSPSDQWCSDEGESFRVPWVVHNPSGQVVRDVPVAVTWYDPDIGRWTRVDDVVSLKPGESRLSTMVSVAPGCDKTVTVRVEINPGKTVAEPNFANNWKEADFYIEPEEKSDGGSRPVLGR
jgi:hypothetical protein